jgi:hypothetical protein
MVNWVIVKRSLFSGLSFVFFEATFWNLSWYDFKSAPYIIAYIFSLDSYSGGGFDLKAIFIGLFFFFVAVVFFSFFIYNVFKGIQELRGDSREV